MQALPQDDALPVFRQYLPRVTAINPGVNHWDIPQSIQKLSYLVHRHYRYYGKFPSVVAGQILEQYAPPGKDHYVLDHFCGSGTSLVEAKLRGIVAYGLDIGWLSALASNVKIRHVDLDIIATLTGKIQDALAANAPPATIDDNFTRKWFSLEVTRDLHTVQNFLLSLPDSTARDFLLIAFLGIIRRVSLAHDAEVRPHIHKDKRHRDVAAAFAKKITDMSRDHAEFMTMTAAATPAECFVGNNLALPARFNDGKCYLAISHPPYLNSFNYSPVYSLEYYWGQPWENLYSTNRATLHKDDLKVHPASDRVTENYFTHLQRCYEQLHAIQPRGAHLAIVIGDCTRNGVLVDVVGRTTAIVETIGYRLVETNYRSTHYGLGKYAYKHRADYHGAGDGKKDAIIIFKKPC